MKALFIAGEASGDLFGAELTGALRTLHPDVEAFGLGGPRMRRAGVRILRDTGAWGAIGVVNALRVLPRALEAYQALKRHLRHSPPDVLVPIDFGAFNVRAGRFARSLGIPVYYFIAPGSWRKTGPVSPELLQSADRFLSQLPWHAERLRAAGASADFFGHPLVDLARPSVPPQALRREWGVREGEAVVCILPGSRRHEVEHTCPPSRRGHAHPWPTPEHPLRAGPGRSGGSPAGRAHSAGARVDDGRGYDRGGENIRLPGSSPTRFAARAR